MTTVLDSPPVGRPGTPGRWDRSQLPYLLVLALGALGGFAFLGRSALYLDEAVSTSIARTPWHRFTDVVVHQESNQSLYYLVLRGWIHVGDSEFVMRTLSVVAVVAALAVLMYVTNELFGRKVALVCGVLLAVDPLIVEMAQDVRGYALSVLFVSASSALFVHAITRSSGPLSAGWTSWAGYVVFSALAAYTNFWAALIPVAHAVSLAFLPPGGIPWRRLVPSGVVLALLLVPLGLLIHANDSSGKYKWASGTSAGHLFAKVRAKVPHAAIDLVVLLVVAHRIRGRPPAPTRAIDVVRPPVAAHVHRQLAGRPPRRGGAAVVRLQAAARRPVPRGLPAARGHARGTRTVQAVEAVVRRRPRGVGRGLGGGPGQLVQERLGRGLARRPRRPG